MMDDTWIKIGPLPGPIYAEMVAEALKKEGIPVRLMPDALASAYGIKGATHVSDGVYLYVPAEHETRTREILNIIIDHF